MQDSHGRQIDYLRIALTDRCNLRCIYCMPACGVPVTPAKQLLTPGELERAARAAVSLGFRKFRLTGGEPTLRADLVEIVARLANIPGVEQLVMTTNGARLAELAEPLARAGLERVNLHLDSLEPHSLSQTMPFNSLERAWQAIAAAEAAGLEPIKINAVVVKGCNDHFTPHLAQLTKKRDWVVRFIELIPVGETAGFALEHFVSSEATRAAIEARHGPLVPLNGGQVVGEAKLYRLPGWRGKIGFISPVSEPYCDSCSRMRLTADGRLRPCLLSDREFDLRAVLRRGGAQHELEQVFRQAVLEKPVGWRLQEGIYPQNRTMGQVGG